MSGFVDEAVIEVFSGKGGPGAVAFRREKFAPMGGPSGGDGGKGGDVVFIVKKNLKTLSHIKQKRIFKAQNGINGMGKRCNGKDGDDTIIEVPPGTIIKDYFSSETLKDFTTAGEVWTFLKGGKGGKGNWHFRTSTNQAPRFAQKGEEGKHRKLVIELNLIADIGLVGIPNAGKSTLLSVLTNATPEIAPYPFTTKIPNLGVMRLYNQDIVIADIPGIIEGASHGAGLGLQFLKHISRTFVIALLIDLSDDTFLSAYDILRNELKNFHEDLLDKNKIIIGTKLDIEGTEERLIELKSLHPDTPVIGICAVTGIGIENLKQQFFNILKKDHSEIEPA